MTDTESRASADPIDAANALKARAGDPIETSVAAPPMTYREAKKLAATERRSGAHRYAIYDIALDNWFVK
jgi:hypothetical protein